MDDSELLRQYVEGRSEAAFAALVKRHLDMVFSAARRQVGGDAHRAQDVAQTVFADLARKAPALTAHTALVGWLYTSTHFAAAKVRRHEQRRAQREKEAHAMHELLDSVADRVDWERLRPVLDQAMHALKPRDREAVLLRFFENRSFAEVGRHLGLGENAARMSVERALDKLGGLLAQRGITSSTAALSVALSHQAVAAAPAGMAAAVASGALGHAALLGSAGVGALLASFMAHTKLTFGLAALAGLLAIGTGVVTETRAARIATEIAGLAQETAELTVRRQEIEARLAPPEETRPPSQVTVAPEAAEPAETKSEQFTRALLNDPETIRLRAQRERMSTSRKLTGLYRDLSWTAAQIAQFEGIVEAAITEDFQQQGGVQIKAGAMTLSPEIAAQLRRIRGDFENRLQATFGDAALQQFLALERTSAMRDVAGEIAGRVYFTSTPLTAGQADALVHLLVANTPPSDPGRTLADRAVNWDQVFAEAQGILAPAQLTALRAIRLKAELDAKRFAVLFPEARP